MGLDSSGRSVQPSGSELPCRPRYDDSNPSASSILAQTKTAIGYFDSESPVVRRPIGSHLRFDHGHHCCRPSAGDIAAHDHARRSQRQRNVPVGLAQTDPYVGLRGHARRRTGTVRHRDASCSDAGGAAGESTAPGPGLASGPRHGRTGECLIPQAGVGFVGMARDEKTHQPVPYLESLPADLSSTPVYVLDPMLATGGSIVRTIDLLIARGATDVTAICVVVAPEGIEALKNSGHPVRLLTASIDDGLNENAFLIPGLGDAGDRQFGPR